MTISKVPQVAAVGAPRDVNELTLALSREALELRQKLNELINELNNLTASAGHTIQEDGVDLATQRSRLNFANGVDAVDDGSDSTDISVDYETSASNIKDAGGTASVGVLDTLARSDHVHGKGNLADRTINETISAGTWTFNNSLSVGNNLTMAGSGIIDMNQGSVVFDSGHTGIVLKSTDSVPQVVNHYIKSSGGVLQILRDANATGLIIGDGTNVINTKTYGELDMTNKAIDNVKNTSVVAGSSALPAPDGWYKFKISGTEKFVPYYDTDPT